MSDKSTQAEKPEPDLTFRLQTGGITGERPSLAKMWIEDVVRRQEVGDENPPPGFYFRPEENSERPIFRVVENTAESHTTVPPIESSASTIVSTDQPYYFAPVSSATTISVRSPVPGQGAMPTGRIEYKNSWLMLDRDSGDGLYTVGLFFDSDVAPGPGHFEGSKEKYRLYLDTCDRYTWIFHKDLKEMDWPGSGSVIVNGEPSPTRDWEAHYPNFTKPKGIHYDLGMLKKMGKSILLSFSDGAKAAIYLAAPESRMNFQTSMREDGSGMNHVSIRLQYGVAVAANYLMASHHAYHGALGLALGKYPAPNSAIMSFFPNLRKLGMINLDDSVTIRILPEHRMDEDPLEMFSYVHFGKDWHGPNEPHWTKYIKVIKSGPGEGFHDWAVMMTRVHFAESRSERTNQPNQKEVYELKPAIKVLLDTGSNHTWLPGGLNKFLQKGIFSRFGFPNGIPGITDGNVVIPKDAGDPFRTLDGMDIGFEFQTLGGVTGIWWGRASSFFLGGRTVPEESLVKTKAYDTCVHQTTPRKPYVLGLNFFQTFVVRLNEEIPNVPTVQIGSQITTQRYNLVGSHDESLS